MLKSQTQFNRNSNGSNAQKNANQQNLPKSLKNQSKKKNKTVGDIEFYQKNSLNYITEIITISLQIAPNYFRNYVVSQNQKFLKYPCLSLICDNFIQNDDMNIRFLVN